jgi:hypothetical protein
LNQKREQSAPGTSLVPLGVRLLMLDSSFACVSEDTPATMQKLITREISVYSGCPPNKHIELEIPSSFYGWCGDYLDVPCSYYESGRCIGLLLMVDFRFTVNLVDERNMNVQRYNGDYWIQITGAGTTPEDIKPFSEHEKWYFNYDLQGNHSGQTLWYPNFEHSDKVTLNNWNNVIG